MANTPTAEAADTEEQATLRDLEFQVLDHIRTIALADSAVDILVHKFDDSDVDVSAADVHNAINMLFTLLRLVTEDIGLAPACFLVHANLAGLERVIGMNDPFESEDD